MKLHDLKQILSEMPYEHDGEMKREPFKSSFISDGSLKRNYLMLGFIEALDELIELHVLNDIPPTVLGTISSKKPSGEDSNRAIFSLRFKPKHTLTKIPKEIDSSKIIQVDKVSIDKDFQGFGVASFAYAQLAKRGFIVLSDTSQFKDGKELWKKMASRAHLKDYSVYLLDDEYGFIQKDGEPVVYDGSNIDDAEIWSNSDDVSKEHILLMMK
jgi:hypothetical protein